MLRLKLALLATVLLFMGSSAQCAVVLHDLFTDGAVLQQGQAIPVWGTAKDGERVTVKLADQEVSTVAREGRWMVRLKPVKAGGPYTMTVTGENTITVRDLLVGEVWLCSGQSNMAFQLHRAEDAQQAIASAADPQLRFFQVPHESDDQPRNTVSGQWKESSPQTASNFSAVAYFFGRDLRRALGVPIGLIDASVGGTPAEAWTPRKTLESSPEFKSILERHAEAVRTFKADTASGKLKDARDRHKQKVKAAKESGKAAPRTPANFTDPSITAKRPSGLYNAMIAPLQPYGIAGAIWYQGEANAGRATEYTPLLSAMIRSWRQAWGQGEFPFLFVQLAPHERLGPEIREAQLRAWHQVPRTAMIVTTDVGHPTDIHPKAKEPVGARLALAARAIAYGEKITYSGPICESATMENGKVILSFKHVDGGLVAKGGDLRGFEIEGPDGKLVPAKATIKGKQVVVSAPGLSRPAGVHYGWTNVPDVNLFNKEGLPATPFKVRIK